MDTSVFTSPTLPGNPAAGYFFDWQPGSQDAIIGMGSVHEHGHGGGRVSADESPINGLASVHLQGYKAGHVAGRSEPAKGKTYIHEHSWSGGYVHAMAPLADVIITNNLVTIGG